MTDKLTQICSHYGFSIEDLLNGSHKQDIVEIRFALITLLHLDYQYSLSKLSKLFNYKAHTSGKHAYYTFQNWMQNYEKYRVLYEKVKQVFEGTEPKINLLHYIAENYSEGLMNELSTDDKLYAWMLKELKKRDKSRAEIYIIASEIKDKCYEG